MPSPADHLPRDELERRLLAYAQEGGRNPLFSGASVDLGAWFDTVEHACGQRQIPSTQRAETAILLILPPQLAAIMQERQSIYLGESNAAYWPWDAFKQDIEAVVSEIEAARNSTFQLA